MRLGQNLNKEKLKLSELLNGAYASSPTSNGTWISDTELTFIDWQYNFVLYDAATNQTRSIVIASLMVSMIGEETLERSSTSIAETARCSSRNSLVRSKKRPLH